MKALLLFLAFTLGISSFILQKKEDQEGIEKLTDKASAEVKEDISVGVMCLGSARFQVAIFNDSREAIKIASSNCLLGFDQFQIEFEAVDGKTLVFRRKQYSMSRPPSYREIEPGSFFSPEQTINLFDGFWLLNGNVDFGDLKPIDLGSGKIRVKYLPSKCAFRKSLIKNNIFVKDLGSEWVRVPQSPTIVCEF